MMSENLNQIEFAKWPKTPRTNNNNVVITEKMDGTNACIVIRGGEIVAIQSRNRFIKPGDDNMGFAHWVSQNAEALVELGDGYHFGEWCGPGIQKNPHMLEQKEFYLFNVFRPAETLPDIVKQVRVLYQGPFTDEVLNTTMSELWQHASEQQYVPEGVIVYSHATKSRSKMTFANSQGKWKNNG